MVGECGKGPGGADGLAVPGRDRSLGRRMNKKEARAG